jgi:CubicO group peptidase (beta-lactamase class C family)
MNDQHRRITIDDLTSDSVVDCAIPNSAFFPSAQALSARHELAATLNIAQTPMHLSLASGTERCYLGKRIDLFPRCALEFITSEATLLPVNRGIQRPLSGESYWDIIVSPGRIWAEAEDKGWSRAAFPFVLSHSMENDAHNGLGLFFFNESNVSQLRFQITQQTAPYLLPKRFDAWGQLKLVPMPIKVADPASVRADFRLEVDGYLPIKPLTAIATPDMLSESRFDPGAETAITYGLMTANEIYASPAVTRQGACPFQQQMRHGSWSMAKSAAATLSMLRLARLYGDQVIDLRVADYVDVSGSHSGWNDVTLGDCLNMATGIGDGQTTAEPIDIKADDKHDPDVSSQGAALYRQWYEKPSAMAKLDACLSYGNYPWGPGKVARYRDPDLYMAGVVMDNYYKSRAGAGADLWQMMSDDVYRAIGIHHLPMNRTIEADGSTGLTLMAFGLFLTLDDMAKIANLIHRGGRVDTRQLLNPDLLAAAIDQRFAKGLPTGYNTVDGPITYHMAFWHYPYKSQSGQIYYIPAMRGYGGNILLLLPNGMSAFRIANDAQTKNQNPYDALSFIRLADMIQAF